MANQTRYTCIRLGGSRYEVLAFLFFEGAAIPFCNGFSSSMTDQMKEQEATFHLVHQCDSESISVTGVSRCKFQGVARTTRRGKAWQGMARHGKAWQGMARNEIFLASSLVTAM